MIYFNFNLQCNTKAINEFQPPSKRVMNPNNNELQKLVKKYDICMFCNKSSCIVNYNIQISINEDHDDEPGSNSPLNDEFVKEKDYSDPESDILYLQNLIVTIMTTTLTTFTARDLRPVKKQSQLVSWILTKKFHQQIKIKNQKADHQFITSL